MRLAAIDIGSNAVRLLINDVSTYTDGSIDFTKVNLIRVPLRLGFDVFENGIIGEQKQHDLIETLKAFKHLINVYQVQAIKICATSAMRDAKNSLEVVNRVEVATGLKINVISGSEEAMMLYETHLADTMDIRFNYMYIDVGGGSTELTIYGKSINIVRQSFNIGTIRILKKQVEYEIWEDMKSFIKKHVKENTVAIGTGGNISKLFSMSKKKNGKPLTLNTLREFAKELSPLSTKERMHLYGFKEDRADVIVPALEIYIAVMKWAEISEIYVPQIGLADGLIKQLFYEKSFTSLKGLKKPFYTNVNW